jgi:hypothetical protein
MVVWMALFAGLIAGWLIEWVIDWLYWRRSADAYYAAEQDLRRRLAEAQATIADLRGEGAPEAANAQRDGAADRTGLG